VRATRRRRRRRAARSTSGGGGGGASFTHHRTSRPRARVLRDITSTSRERRRSRAGRHARAEVRARAADSRALSVLARGARVDGAREPADRVLAAGPMEGWILGSACGYARWLRRALAIGGADAHACACLWSASSVVVACAALTALAATTTTDGRLPVTSDGDRDRYVIHDADAHRPLGRCRPWARFCAGARDFEHANTATGRPAGLCAVCARRAGRHSEITIAK